MRNLDITMIIKFSEDYVDVYANGPDDVSYFKKIVRDSLGVLDPFYVREISCDQIDNLKYKFEALISNDVDSKETIDDLKAQIAEALDDESYAIVDLKINEI